MKIVTLLLHRWQKQYYCDPFCSWCSNDRRNGVNNGGGGGCCWWIWCAQCFCLLCAPNRTFRVLQSFVYYRRRRRRRRLHRCVFVMAICQCRQLNSFECDSSDLHFVHVFEIAFSLINRSNRTQCTSASTSNNNKTTTTRSHSKTVDYFVEKEWNNGHTTCINMDDSMWNSYVWHENENVKWKRNANNK